jgi:pimeloyl-ACP methyl ester carboxylesterase
MAHGFGSCRGREYLAGSLELVKSLVASGFTVLMLDLRGHGESDAAPVTYGLRERSDFLGAVDWLLAQGYASRSIGVLGVEMGGVAAMGAAAEETAIGAVIADSAYANPMPIIRRQFQRTSGLPLAFLPATLLIARLLTGIDLVRLRSAEVLCETSRRPALIIQARGDKVVPLDHGLTLARAAGAELWLSDATVYQGSLLADPIEYTSRVIAFLDVALSARSTAPDYAVANAEDLCGHCRWFEADLAL